MEPYGRPGRTAAHLYEVAELAGQPQPASTGPADGKRQMPGHGIAQARTTVADLAGHRLRAGPDPDHTRSTTVLDRVGGDLVDGLHELAHSLRGCTGPGRVGGHERSQGRQLPQLVECQAQRGRGRFG